MITGEIHEITNGFASYSSPQTNAVTSFAHGDGKQTRPQNCHRPQADTRDREVKGRRTLIAWYINIVITFNQLFLLSSKLLRLIR